MADDALTEERAAPARPWRGLPVAVQIGAYYLVARLVTTGFLVVAAQMSGATSRFGENATIADLMVGWDAQWYWYTALNGYPTTLPLTESGGVAENSWAFMPIYAYLSNGLGWILGSWGAAAVLVSLVAGYGASVTLYRMLRPRLDHSAALWAVVFFTAGPLAAMFQVGYAESLFLLWLFLSLLMVIRRRYVWLYLLIPLMAFTRPGVLAFALFLALFGIWRWIRREIEPLRTAEVVHLIALAALATVTGFAWQVAAGVVTGDPGAYLATELAWRRNWLPDTAGAFVPFEGFLQATAFWFTTWGLGEVTGYVALALSVAALAAALILLPVARRVGVEVRLWSASYLLYLLAVFFPQSSIFRLLLPLSPLWGVVAVPRSRGWRVGVLLLCLLGQWWWIYNMYALGNTYWQIP
ncbi:hypothetical protein ACFM35_03850 [Microbacterium sp. P01]|uniref:hypothetical protein n=1 Tax=Microbacterium sp. P01 TaxID=3366261 RepID=UPI00366C676E